MNCAEVQERLSAYHDGELSPDQAAQVVAHLAECSACAEQLASFDQLSGLCRRLTDPPVPTHLWMEIESKLDGATGPRVGLRRILPRQVPAPHLALAATILIAVGIGVVAYVSWFSPPQPDRLAINFAHYLEEFSRKPDEAQQFLMAKYDGRPTTLHEATDILGYEPLAAKGLPPGYTLDKVYLHQMPCCMCTEVVCKNKDGESIAVFEHDANQPVWFGDRPTIQCICQEIPTSVIQIGDRLAASWKAGERYVTVVGASDLDEVTQFVAHFGG